MPQLKHLLLKQRHFELQYNFQLYKDIHFHLFPCGPKHCYLYREFQTLLPSKTLSVSWEKWYEYSIGFRIGWGLRKISLVCFQCCSPVLTEKPKHTRWSLLVTRDPHWGMSPLDVSIGYIFSQEPQKYCGRISAQRFWFLSEHYPIPLGLMLIIPSIKRSWECGSVQI